MPYQKSSHGHAWQMGCRRARLRGNVGLAWSNLPLNILKTTADYTTIKPKYLSVHREITQPDRWIPCPGPPPFAARPAESHTRGCGATAAGPAATAVVRASHRACQGGGGGRNEIRLPSLTKLCRVLEEWWEGAFHPGSD